jgi:plasmid stabilization system protein ParE
VSLRIRPQAQQDILNRADELGEEYTPLALAFLDRVDETIRFLEQFPHIGAQPPEPLPAALDLRFFPVRRFRNYLIAFLPLPDGDGVEVVRVIDGRRDLGAIFGSDPV